MTNIKCRHCGLVNTPNSQGCRRCGALLNYKGAEAFAHTAPYAANPSGHQYSNTAQFPQANADTPWYGLDIPIPLEGFEGHDIVLRTRLLSNTKLLKDGLAMAKNKGRIQLTANDGSLVELRLKSRFLDPVPNIEVYGRTIVLLAALNPLAYIWSGIPLVLILLGGGIGGACGGVACAINAQIFRTQLSVPAKFAITALVSGAAFVGWLFVALLFTLLLGGPARGRP
jgi:hypothetical protein